MAADIRALKSHSSQQAGRIFAIGDIHGCAAELGSLLQQISPRRDDTVVFLGDYIDRGPDSKGVVDRILELKKSCRVICLRGNHEEMFLDFLESPESVGAGLFVLNGGATTIASYAGPNGSFELPENHLEFFYELQTTYETDDYFFVHAGVPVKPLAEIDLAKDEMTLLWGRQPFLSSPFKWEKTIVHGHTPVAAPEKLSNRINVDTGCVYDGSLTAVELPSGRFYQVPKGVKGEAFYVPGDGQRLAVRFKGKLPVLAGRPNKSKFEFETLNYNQFGVLMKEKSFNATPHFMLEDSIEGTIGAGIGVDHSTAIRFHGTVVRIESRGQTRLYGIKIDRASSTDDGRDWIRPENV